MKRLFSVILFVFFAGYCAVAQNRSICFEETNEWKAIVTKARNQNKLIFIDCYSSTCPPCRYLAEHVFTLDEVADYFNAHFINAKFNMQKDPYGRVLARRYEVAAYPTLLFIDPHTGQPVHRMVGNNGLESFMHGARIAGDARHNLAGMMRRYAGGEREPEFVEEYIDLLSAAYMRRELSALLPDYFKGLDDGHFFTQRVWKLYKQNISDPLAPSSRRFLANPEKLDPIVPADKIIKKISGDLQRLVVLLTSNNTEEFNEKVNAELIGYLETLQLKEVPVMLSKLYTAEFARKGDYRGLFNKVKKEIDSRIFTPEEERYYVSNFLGFMKGCHDRKLLRQTFRWVGKYAGDNTDCLFLAGIYPLQILLLENLGKGEDVAKLKQLNDENHEKVLDTLEKKLGIKLSRSK